MKSQRGLRVCDAAGHPPHGGCGLKWVDLAVANHVISSSPARGMWIEISSIRGCCARSASSPARGMWIEIHESYDSALERIVIPRTGDVD